MCATRVFVQQQWNSNSWLNVVYEFRSANSNNSASRPKLLKRMLFDVVLQISTQGLRLLGTATPPCFGSCGAWSVRVVSYWSLTLGRFLKEWICHVEKFVTHNISWIFDMTLVCNDARCFLSCSLSNSELVLAIIFDFGQQVLLSNSTSSWAIQIFKTGSSWR